MARRFSALDVDFDKELVESAIERYGVDVDARPNNVCGFGAHYARSVDYGLSAFRQVNANVLKTVLVAAGIKHSVGVDAYHIALGSALSS